MTKSNLPPSARKFIRKEKARIRREFFSADEQKRKIGALYEKYQSQQAGRIKTSH